MHPRASNVAKTPFAASRLRTDAAKRPKAKAATAVIWKMPFLVDKSLRRLRPSHLLAEVLAPGRFPGAPNPLRRSPRDLDFHPY